MNNTIRDINYIKGKIEQFESDTQAGYSLSGPTSINVKFLDIYKKLNSINSQINTIILNVTRASQEQNHN